MIFFIHSEILDNCVKIIIALFTLCLQTLDEVCEILGESKRP